MKFDILLLVLPGVSAEMDFSNLPAESRHGGYANVEPFVLYLGGWFLIIVIYRKAKASVYS